MQTVLLEVVHRATVDVVAARKRLEERIDDLEEGGRRIGDQHAAAVAAGEEQADLLAEQSARAQQRAQELRADLDELRRAEELLTARAAQMQDQIADFRNTMALVNAKAIAARTSGVAAEALDTLRDALTYIELVVSEPRQRRPEMRTVTVTSGTSRSSTSSTSSTSVTPDPAE